MKSPMTAASPVLGNRCVRVCCRVRAWASSPPGKTRSRDSRAHRCDSRLAALLGSMASTTPLSEPTEAGHDVRRDVALASACSIPTWTAPRLPPPPSTYPTGRGRSAMLPSMYRSSQPPDRAAWTARAARSSLRSVSTAQVVLPGSTATVIGLAALGVVAFNAGWLVVRHLTVMAHEGAHALTGLVLFRSVRRHQAPLGRHRRDRHQARRRPARHPDRAVRLPGPQRVRPGRGQAHRAPVHPGGPVRGAVPAGRAAGRAPPVVRGDQRPGRGRRGVRHRLVHPDGRPGHLRLRGHLAAPAVRRAPGGRGGPAVRRRDPAARHHRPAGRCSGSCSGWPPRWPRPP